MQGGVSGAPVIFGHLLGQILPEMRGFAHGGATADVIRALSCWEAPGSELCMAPNPAASAAPRLQTLSVSIIN